MVRRRILDVRGWCGTYCSLDIPHFQVTQVQEREVGPLNTRGVIFGVCRLVEAEHLHGVVEVIRAVVCFGVSTGSAKIKKTSAN